ncbi:hypothetical protein AAP_01836 [Ascosphaera apis ARSEF 7405]|uniref:Uncharacterized protein n=1 Tax=Ascosphaera apis ARSEF 7405 TaxID=392613 RepID=A0A168AYQ9_9EURO|nr:hypothetical protein AAP_01836 [Ascosphaera apis ARSEF 7405]
MSKIGIFPSSLWVENMPTKHKRTYRFKKIVDFAIPDYSSSDEEQIRRLSHRIAPRKYRQVETLHPKEDGHLQQQDLLASTTHAKFPANVICGKSVKRFWKVDEDMMYDADREDNSIGGVFGGDGHVYMKRKRGGKKEKVQKRARRERWSEWMTEDGNSGDEDVNMFALSGCE